MLKAVDWVHRHQGLFFIAAAAVVVIVTMGGM